VTKRRKRRVWSDDEKRMICGQTRVTGVSVSQVARRYDVNANLVFAWLRDPRFADVGAADVARFLPVDIVAEAKAPIGRRLLPTVASRSSWRAGTGCGSAAAMIPRRWRG
jgi:transposase